MTGIEAAMKAVSLGYLSVDEQGRVWDLVSRAARKIEQRPVPRRAERTHKNGYLYVHFFIDGRQFNVLAHRMVWTALRGPIPNGMDINHIDGWKGNNSPDNLEVVTRSE